MAAELGATAIGFIFWPGSPRFLAPDMAREIVDRVRRRFPALTTVGVFVDETADRILECLRLAGLDAAQLHGSESPEYCRQLLDLGVPQLIKAIGMRGDGTADVAAFDPEIVMLLDAHDPERHGGTGRTVDWDEARRIAAARPAILSGGLTAENVRRAVAGVQPYGLDVSSGVESAPGVKDRKRMASFFEALHD